MNNVPLKQSSKEIKVESLLFIFTIYISLPTKTMGIFPESESHAK